MIIIPLWARTVWVFNFLARVFPDYCFFRGIFIISPNFSHRVHIIYYRSAYVYMYVWDAVSDVCFGTTYSYTPYAHYRWPEARKHEIFPANLSSPNAKTSGQKTFPVDDIHITYISV